VGERSVGVGFVGSGSVLWAYLRALDSLVARGVAWEGPISARRPETWPEILRRRPGAHIVSDAAGVIDSDVDIVAVLTPPSSHAEIAMAALDAGKHVLVEKPFGITRPEAEEVVGLAADRALYAMAAPFVLLSPSFQELWRLVDAHDIGVVHSARALYGNPGSTWARWFHESGVGPLGDLAVYNLKSLTTLLGAVTEVLAAESTAVRPRVVGDVTIEDPDADTPSSTIAVRPSSCTGPRARPTSSGTTLHRRVTKSGATSKEAGRLSNHLTRHGGGQTGCESSSRQCATAALRCRNCARTSI
jgi:predicted dehydrogenase